MTNCGNLFNIKDLPHDWEKQILEIKEIFIEKKLYILDLRFLPYTPFILNNVCIKDNNIYLVDVTMFKKRSNLYINFRIYFLIYKIKLYRILLYFRPLLFIVHYLLEIYRLFEDLIEIVLLRDISIIQEFKNLISYIY